jgi:hypothetical protein
MNDQPTPGTPEWQQWVAEQKTHVRRDGHDHEALETQLRDSPVLRKIEEAEDET